MVGTSVSEGMGIFIFASFIKLLTQGGDYLHPSNDLNFLQAFFLFKNSNSLFNLGIMLILVSLNTLIFRVLLLLTSGKSSSRVEAELSYLYSKSFFTQDFSEFQKKPKSLKVNALLTIFQSQEHPYVHFCCLYHLCSWQYHYMPL